MDRAALDRELTEDEGRKLFAYDDADGSRIKSGHTVRGVITGGVGCNLEFLYPEESDFLLHNRQDRSISDLTRLVPVFGALDDVRQRALVNLYFNVPGFLHWPRFMGYVSTMEWDKAAGELEVTHPWIDQVGARGHRIVLMLRDGVRA